jgi:hypothetical protein
MWFDLRAFGVSDPELHGMRLAVLPVMLHVTHGGAVRRMSAIAAILLAYTGCSTADREDGDPLLNEQGGQGADASAGPTSGAGGTRSMNIGGQGGSASEVPVSPEPTADCPRTDACENTCTASVSACLLDPDGEAFTQSRLIVAEVVSVAVEAWEWPFECIAISPFYRPLSERLRVVMRDVEGVQFELALSPDVPATTFAVGSTLSVDYRHQFFNIFVTDRGFTVREADELVFFLFHTKYTNVFELEEVAFSDGEPICERSVPSPAGCTSSRTAVNVAIAGEEAASPCQDEVAGYVVTALQESAGQAPESCGGREPGRCDAQSTFLATGWRATDD